VQFVSDKVLCDAMQQLLDESVEDAAASDFEAESPHNFNLSIFSPPL